MNFMIVDDSDTMRRIVGLALKPAQYDFVEAENGQDALSKLSNTKVDFFIVDINMPVMNGIDLVKELRSKPEYSKTPIVMLTNESDDAVILQGKKAGANAWIIKPFKNEEFLNLIQKLI
jgi:two-component system, chemotaxis family, chemotaxis protein CheY